MNARLLSQARLFGVPVSILLVLPLIVAGALFMHAHWTGVMTRIMAWQQQFHSLLSQHMQVVQENPGLHGAALMGLSFAYGVFHALGPGHGKAIIVAYLGTHRESLPRAVLISMAAAFLQALVAVSLVGVLALILSLRLSDVQHYGAQMTLVSLGLIMLLGLALILSAGNQLRLARKARQMHQHHAVGCCAGHHAVSQVETATSWRYTAGVVISMGIRPCLGALLVLIYAHLVGAWSYGILATFFMGLGTGVSVTAIAVATQLARGWLERQMTRSGSHQARSHSDGWLWLRLAGGCVIVLLGWGLFDAAISASAGRHPLF